MFQVGLPCYLALNSGRSVSINVNKTRKLFSRNIHGARMFPQGFPVSHRGKHCFQGQVLLSRCKLFCTAGNFNENPSMRALAKILGARASKDSSNFWRAIWAKAKFCEHFQIGWDHSIPLHLPALTPFIYKICHFIYFSYSFGVCVRFICCQISYHCI